MIRDDSNTPSLDDLFGEVRGMVHCSIFGDTERAQLWHLMQRAYQIDLARYTEQWIPYLEQFSTRWQPTSIPLHTIQEFLFALRLAPFAQFSLNIHDEERIKRSARDAFIRSKRLCRLHTLHIPCTYFESHLPGLINSHNLSALHTLGLRDPTWSYDLVSLLHHMPRRRTLTHLHLTGHRYTSHSVPHKLHELDVFTQINALSLSSAQQDPELINLLNSPSCASLHTLALRYRQFDAQYLSALIESPYLTNLTTLRYESDQSHTQSGVALERLLHLPALAHLRHLSLNRHFTGRVPTRSFRTFIHSPHLNALESLELDHCRLGIRATRWLANSPSLSGLKHLSLAESSLGEGGYKVLARSPNLANLQTLTLTSRYLSQEIKDTLLDSPYLSDSVKTHYG